MTLRDALATALEETGFEVTLDDAQLVAVHPAVAAWLRANTVPHWHHSKVKPDEDQFCDDCHRADAALVALDTHTRWHAGIGHEAATHGCASCQYVLNHNANAIAAARERLHG